MQNGETKHHCCYCPLSLGRKQGKTLTYNMNLPYCHHALGWKPWQHMLYLWRCALILKWAEAVILLGYSQMAAGHVIQGLAFSWWIHSFQHSMGHHGPPWSMGVHLASNLQLSSHQLIASHSQEKNVSCW